VTPAPFGNIEAQLLVWGLAMLRPGAALLAAPLFGASAVPVQVRIILSLAIGIPAAAVANIAPPPDGVISVNGLLLVMGELVLGLAMGFAIQIGFAAAQIAGEIISNAMGLGFASMQDPASGHSSTAIGQFLNMLGTALFLCMNGHLALIDAVVRSFAAMPPGRAWLAPDALRGLVDFAGLMFAAGVAIAIPVAFALILVQIVMAMVTRAAPALNLFSVGIPATVLAGLMLMAAAVPALADAIEHTLGTSLDQVQVLTRQ
jgi:flagellar biosynthesis protein FliR